MLNGKLKGDMQSVGTLIVGARAVVEAAVHARIVVVRGEIIGDIVATERVELKAGARVFGDLDTPVLRVEEGAVIEGRTRMTQESRGAGTRAV